MKKPIQIETCEWWFKGNFIQKQNEIRSDLIPYHVFKDTEVQETVGVCHTFTEAKRLCNMYPVKNPVSGWKEQLKAEY